MKLISQLRTYLFMLLFDKIVTGRVTGVTCDSISLTDTFMDDMLYFDQFNIYITHVYLFRD